MTIQWLPNFWYKDVGGISDDLYIYIYIFIFQWSPFNLRLILTQEWEFHQLKYHWNMSVILFQAKLDIAKRKRVVIISKPFGINDIVQNWDLVLKHRSHREDWLRVANPFISCLKYRGPCVKPTTCFSYILLIHRIYSYSREIPFFLCMHLRSDS